MSTDPQRPAVLLAVATDVEAAAIVTALTAHGIRAMAVGGYTAGFRAEAPAKVQIVVRQAELEPARSLLAEIQRLDNEAAGT